MNILQEEDAYRAKWAGDYDGTECPNCGRLRMLKCSNGQRRCEKCNWEVPLFVSLFNLGYRYVESTEGDKYAWQKFGCDETGVLVRFSLDFI